MPRLLPTLANALWALSALPDALRFWHGLGDVRATQGQTLRRILRTNADSEVGRRHGFAEIDSVAAFRRRVPLTTYDDLAPAIERIAAGERGVLTGAPVRLLEPTSGSAAATKWIPYTASLQQDFHRAIAPWIVDLMRHHPRVLTGTAYWSVSPVGDRPAETEGGVPVGFEDDSAYLGPVRGRLVRAALAVPPAVQRLRDVDAFRYVTLLGLVRAADLTLVSVWNPTFFTILLDRLSAWGDRLARDVADGTITPPGALPAGVRAALQGAWSPDPERAAAIRRAIAQDAPRRHRALWPRLRVVSCWADGPAAPYAHDLRTQLPHAHLQPKGLLATEGVVTIPQHDAPGPVPAVRSHFFEFVPAEGGDSVGLEALADGGRYDVVLTTSGGLYRYRLHDRVEVVGRWRGVPCLRFVGTTDRVSDHVGEKLHAEHAQRVLDRVLPAHDVAPSFAMLGLERGDPPAYTLFVESRAPAAQLDAAGRAVDAALRDNYHYDYARRLGQLGPLRVFRVADGAQATYQARCVAQGQRAGDVKPTPLHATPGWSAHFDGAFV